MKIRHAHIKDARAICGLVNYYAERGRMLHRSLEGVYASLRDFQVLEDKDAGVVACVAVAIFWADLAELKSLAVAPRWVGQGLGGKLVAAARRDAVKLGVKKLFALTYEKEFFSRHGFRTVRREKLPEKVWRECMACPKSDACDEIAMILDLRRSGKRKNRARRRSAKPAGARV